MLNLHASGQAVNIPKLLISRPIYHMSVHENEKSFNKNQKDLSQV